MANTVIEGPFTIGDDWVMTFTLTRGGVAVDLSGSTKTASIWRYADETEVDPDRSVTDLVAASGTCKLTIPKATTATYKPGTHYGDVKVAYVGGVVEHFAQYFQFEAIGALT